MVRCDQRMDVLLEKRESKVSSVSPETFSLDLFFVTADTQGPASLQLTREPQKEGGRIVATARP